MNTRCPISTISYNTEQFLIKELNKMIGEGVIDFYAFIYHFAEGEELGEKMNHRHLYVMPGRLIVTSALNSRLQQIDLQQPDLPPLGCMPWRHSKFGDWYMYCLHDKDYLALQCQERKYHYDKHEFVVSNWEYFNELIHTSDLVKYKSFAKFIELVNSGVNFRELFSNGFIPVQQIVQYKKAFNLMKYGNMDFVPHSDNIEPNFELCAGEEYMPFKVNEDGEILPEN